jgi:hypothetical protein
VSQGLTAWPEFGNSAGNVKRLVVPVANAFEVNSGQSILMQKFIKEGERK